MPRELTITTPSMAKGVIRSWMFGDYDTFGDKTHIPNAKESMAGQCSRVWLRTVDKGPYPDSQFYENGHLRFDGSCLLGDQYAVVIASRGLAKLGAYPVVHRCEYQMCRHFWRFRIDLPKLPWKSLPKSSVEPFVNGNRFETSIEDGGKKVGIAYQLMTHQIALDSENLLPPEETREPLTFGLAIRIKEIENVGTEFPAIWEWVKRLDPGDAFDLINSFDEADCGVDTNIGVICPECGLLQDAEVVLTADFFLKKPLKKTQVFHGLS